MKKTKKNLLLLAGMVLSTSLIFLACSSDDDKMETTITMSQTTTPKLNVGETATATVTIQSDGIISFQYYKIVDEEIAEAFEATDNLEKDGKTFTFDFSYTVQEFDDLGTLGFQFEVTDKYDEVKTTGIVIDTYLSMQSAFVKHDWKVTESEWEGMDVLAPHDAASIFRFHEDGTYDVDLSAEHAVATHHFCYWVLQETPNNADTLAVLRLIRKFKAEQTGMDEYYDYRIVCSGESEMIMYWDVAAFGLFNIKNIFTSQPKGAFQPYGTSETEAIVTEDPLLQCNTVDQDLFNIH